MKVKLLVLGGFVLGLLGGTWGWTQPRDKILLVVLSIACLLGWALIYWRERHIRSQRALRRFAHLHRSQPRPLDPYVRSIRDHAGEQKRSRRSAP